MWEHGNAGEEVASILILGSTVRCYIFVIVAGQMGGSFDVSYDDGNQALLGASRLIFPSLWFLFLLFGLWIEVQHVIFPFSIRMDLYTQRNGPLTENAK